MKHIHLMGICGTAMASLAGLLKARGYHITGSDQNPYPPMSTQLESLGIPVMKGYRKENLHPNPDYVIVGNVISASNEEAQELMRLGIEYTSLPKAMGEFIIQDRDCINVSGTHGKTTTTSLMAWVAQEVGVKPGFLIGGIPKNFSNSFQNPEGNYFIIEGDEYDTAFFDKVPKFTHYKPKHVILTSVEFDHADIYKDLDDVKRAFSVLMKLIPKQGTLLANADDKNVMSLYDQAQCDKKFTYGIHGGDYRILNQKVTSDGIDFEVKFQGQTLGKFTTQMSGEYNLLNAAAVIGMSHQQGWDLEVVRAAVASFQGVKRRQEVLGEPQGVLVIEDFAHHPTAVRETVKGIKAKYSGRKIFGIFEPRSATSRRKIFQKDYVEAFKDCDQVLLAQAFDQSKIAEGDRFSSEELVADISKSGIKASVFANADSIVQEIVKVSKRGDLVLIMSNGGFDGIYGKLLTALEKR